MLSGGQLRQGGAQEEDVLTCRLRKAAGFYKRTNVRYFCGMYSVNRSDGAPIKRSL